MAIVSFICFELVAERFMLMAEYPLNTPIELIVVAAFARIPLVELTQPFAMNLLMRHHHRLFNVAVEFRDFLLGSVELMMAHRFDEAVSTTQHFVIRVVEIIQPPVEFADDADEMERDNVQAAFDRNFSIQRENALLFGAQLSLFADLHHSQ